MKKYVIIGGGIIGCTLARELALKKRGKVIVLEKEPELGRHASGRNSGVIHSGINQKPGTLKAKMCVQGSRLLRDFCKEHGVAMNECGTLVVAGDEKEVVVLEKLLEMGRECGVPGLKLLEPEELREREPLAKGLKALLSPTGAVVDSQDLLRKVADDAIKAGATIDYEQEAKKIDGGKVYTTTRFYSADHIVNCAGLYADRVSRMMGVGREYKIFPFRGEYLLVTGLDVRSMIYQVPDLRFPFLSVHLTKETDGNVLAGPTAILSLGREAYEKNINWGDAFDMIFSLRFYLMSLRPSFMRLAKKALSLSYSRRCFLSEIEKLAGTVLGSQVRPYRSGIRAQMVDAKGDLVSDIVAFFKKDSTHVLNCVSPGMTCSLAFARYLDEKMHEN